ncbi:MAG: endonuclease/exonuclease/phosphatase family protein [Paludibacteraceae bacterium]|nr:endonuclease/exonuclease/phosphatase family protein [Paludibacteraceae bacterium]
MKRFLTILGLIGCLVSLRAEPLRIVSYNVENLFHPKHDSICLDSTTFIEKDDYEWTPEGQRRWSYTRYYRKVENIARVLTNIGEWDGVDIVGLQEVENAFCVKRLCYTLRPGEYDFVHYESPDPRGIDVALIYKKARIDTLSSKAISIQHSDFRTRDILYVKALVDKKDTLHLFVCHLPSQRGGAAESEWKRKIAREVLQGAIDSVYLAFRDPKIIVMGDFNSEPKEDLRGVKNRMKELTGTHKYQGRWTCLDHFYTSPSLDSLSRAEIYNAAWIQEPDEKYPDLKPKRTYNGFRYQKDGFSDHLPIVLKLKIKN